MNQLSYVGMQVDKGLRRIKCINKGKAIALYKRSCTFCCEMKSLEFIQVTVRAALWRNAFTFPIYNSCLKWIGR